MKVLVTGGTGLVGSAIKSICSNYDHDFVFFLQNQEIYLYCQVERFLNSKTRDGYTFGCLCWRIV